MNAIKPLARSGASMQPLARSGASMQPLARSGASMQPLARRSARLAAKPRHNYAHAEAQLDAAVEKYVDPDAYAAKKARAARREEVRQAEIARLVRQAKARKAVAQDIADVASEIINIRSKCLTFDKFHMWWLEREVKELVAKAQPTWTPANLQWAYSYVTDRQTT